MRRRIDRKEQTVSTLFTMLLFLVFVLCSLFTVLTGGKVYENISARMEDNYTGSVALQYIANKVRQGDEADGIRVLDMEGTQVLELSQQIEGYEYISWIYYYDGSIRELFTSADSGLGLSDGIEIMECGGLSFSKEGRLLSVTTEGGKGATLTLALRSMGEGYE